MGREKKDKRKKEKENGKGKRKRASVVKKLKGDKNQNSLFEIEDSTPG